MASLFYRYGIKGHGIDTVHDLACRWNKIFLYVRRNLLLISRVLYSAKEDVDDWKWTQGRDAVSYACSHKENSLKTLIYVK